MSHHPYVSEEVDSNSGSEEYETISYAAGCEELEEITDGKKLPIKYKVAIQNKKDKHSQQELKLHSNVIKSPEQSVSIRNDRSSVNSMIWGSKRSTSPNL